MHSKDFTLPHPEHEHGTTHPHLHELTEDQQRTMLREECFHIAFNAVALYKLLGNLSEEEEIDHWAAEKVGLANDYLRTVKEWFEYELLSKREEEMPDFSARLAEGKFSKLLKEMSAGGTGAGSIASVSSALGGQGMTQKRLKEKQAGYTNVLRKGGPVKSPRIPKVR
jgi:hypothetical protein